MSLWDWAVVFLAMAAYVGWFLIACWWVDKEYYR